MNTQKFNLLRKKINGKVRRTADELLFRALPSLYYHSKLRAYIKNRGMSKRSLSDKKAASSPTVVIEVSNRCNLNCVMCKTQDSARGTGEMPKSLFIDLIKRKKEMGQKDLIIHTVGEPLTCSYFSDILKICRENGMRIRITTNGLLIDKFLGDLKEYSSVIRHMAISIDGATKKTYEKIRVGGRFERLVSNLDALAANNRNVKNRIELSMQACLSRENINEIPAFYRQFGEYFSPLNMLYSFLTNLSSDHKEGSYFYGQRIGADSLYSRRVPCKLLWGQVHVLYDGSVSACCRDYNGELIVGNSRSSSFLDIWNGKLYQELRRKHAAEEVGDIAICRDCYGMREDAVYLFNAYVACLFARFKDREDDFYMNRIYKFLELLPKILDDAPCDTMAEAYHEAENLIF